MPKSIRDDFPLLHQKDGDGRTIAYLDNAATTQKPSDVLDAVLSYYRNDNANPHRGAYTLSARSTAAYEEARNTVAQFIGAPKTEEVIFTRNATEALNMAAFCYGMHFLHEGDEVVLSIAEHHSNIVPWQQVTKARGAKLVYMYTDDEGMLPDKELEKIGAHTKIVAVAHVSNVLGTINPIEEIARRAHDVGAIIVVDGTQSVPHISVDVTQLDADFFAFSAHKMLGPMGVGVLYAKEKYLDAMPPFQFGGDMIEYVEEQNATYAILPQKFEAGTQNVAGAVGLAAAIRYLDRMGMDAVQKSEYELTTYMLEQLLAVPHLTIVGSSDPEKRIGVVAFNLQDAHPHDVASILDTDGVAIRSGHHCAHPLMHYLGVTATCRASLYIYNTQEDIDRMIAALRNVRGWLGLGS